MGFGGSPVTHTRELARNSVYNILGQTLPLPVALVAIPVVVHGLGETRFGLLGIFWMFLTVLELVGFGRAGTRFLALSRGRAAGHAAVGRVVRVTLVAQALVGLAFAGVIAVAAGPLADHVLEMSAALRPEAMGGFLLLAVACPVLTLSGALRGFLEAEQRFAAVNVVRVVGDSLNYLLPAVAVPLGWGVRGIMVLLLAQRGAVAAAYGWVGRDILIGLIGPAGGRPEGGGPREAASVPTVREILGFGAWTTVSSTVSPVLVYLDRFLLGALVGVAAVGLYTAPYDAITHVLLLPASIAAVLFPAVSTLQGRGMHDELRRIQRRSTLAVVALVLPLMVGFVVLAGPGLRLWLGTAATAESVRALQLLAPGVLMNALATVPFSTLQGLGRADVTGKLHMMELPVQVVVAWWMVAHWGVVGAAGAWTFRVTLDSLLLHYAAARLVPSRTR
jgi:O-antigen/teichoic acid export membrane protein